MLIVIALYFLLAVFPVVASSFKVSQKAYNYLSIGTLFIIVVSPILLKKFISEPDINKNAGIIITLSLSLLCLYFRYLFTLHKQIKEAKDDLVQQMNKLNNHPVLNSKEDIDAVITSMFNLSRSREKALDFFTQSLRDIKGKGIVKIDAHFSSYTKLLGELMENAESVIGTFTTRPLKMMKRNDSNTKDYLTIMANNKDKVQRICVFEKNEVSSIADREKREKNKKQSDSELDWFRQKVPAKKTKWTETETFKADISACGSTLENVVPSIRKKMTDFAIFDDILLRWAGDNADYGPIVMLIGEKAIQLRHSMEEYMDTSIYGRSSFNELAKDIKIQ